VLTLFHTRNAVIDHLSYPAGAESVIKVQGTANSNIVITNTDGRAMATGIVLANGATSEAIQMK
jgi:hypothetical protein